MACVIGHLIFIRSGELLESGKLYFTPLLALIINVGGLNASHLRAFCKQPRASFVSNYAVFI